MASALLETPLASLVIDTITDVVGIALLSTGFVAGGFRSFAVLSGMSPERVEWFTAAGFFGGCLFATLVLLLNAVVG